MYMINISIIIRFDFYPAIFLRSDYARFIFMIFVYTCHIHVYILFLIFSLLLLFNLRKCTVFYINHHTLVLTRQQSMIIKYKYLDILP